MAKIKASKTSEYALSVDELDYVVTMNDLRNKHFQEEGQLIGGFLKQVCTNRLGYDVKSNLVFELDFDSEDKKLKVTVQD